MKIIQLVEFGVFLFLVLHQSWRPCNWWGRWLSLLGILIFCGEGKAQKMGGDSVDMKVG